MNTGRLPANQRNKEHELNQHTPPLNPEAVIAVLAKVYPKTMSMTTMQPTMHARRQRIESALLLLVAQGRVKACTHSTVATVYRLSEEEAEQHGFKRENPVRNSYELLTTRPTYTPPRMNPARVGALDADSVPSLSNNRHIPYRPPIGMGSHMPGVR